MSKRDTTIKLDMSFEDALKHVLSVGPMPKDEKSHQPKKRKVRQAKKKGVRNGR